MGSKLGSARGNGFSCYGIRHPLYSRWCGMKQRCNITTRKDSKHYSLKGVRVCERWQKFENFLADMGPSFIPGTTLHRKDDSKGYEPGNVVWADWHTQNSESAHAKILSIAGISKTISDWCRTYGIKPGAFYVRLKCGWTIEEALSTPIRKRGGKNVS